MVNINAGKIGWHFDDIKIDNLNMPKLSGGSIVDESVVETAAHDTKQSLRGLGILVHAGGH